MTYQVLLDQYTYAQVWDPKGWFWKPAEEARKKLVLLQKETAPNLKVAKPNFTAAQLKLPGKKEFVFLCAQLAKRDLLKKTCRDSKK